MPAISSRSIPFKMPEPEFEPDFSIWENSEEVKTHPYLMTKGIKAKGEVRMYGDHLLLPLFENGEIVALQTISKTGQKKFVKGSKFQGGTLVIPGEGGIALCEGYATGCTVHEATGLNVHVAFSCHNMVKAAKQMVGKKVLIAADNDEAGIRAAEQCRKLLMCNIAIPPVEGEDWNDAKGLSLHNYLPSNFDDLEIEDGNPVGFLQEHASYIKSMPKSQQIIQGQRFKDMGITKELFKSVIEEAPSIESSEEVAEARRLKVCPELLCTSVSTIPSTQPMSCFSVMKDLKYERSEI